MNIPSLKIKYNTERERRRHILLADRREALNNSLCESGKRIIILSSDCVGGRILHDFELPEYTPTINNWYSAEDFLKICSNPDYYFSQDVEYTGEDQNNVTEGRFFWHVLCPNLSDNRSGSHLGRFCLTPFANGRSQQDPFPVTFKWGLKMTIYFGKI